MAKETDVLVACAQEIDAIEGVTCKATRKGWDFHMDLEEDPKVAIKQIRLVQTQLRAVKKQVIAAEQQVRQAYSQAISESTYRPGLGGALLGAKYRGAARRAGAHQKDSLRANRDKALAPWEEAKQRIDKLLLQLDMAKTKAQVDAEKQKR
ncbi:MAG: hypothetical protein FJZ90_06730 [Chloroflexi bacterium]|nr:hypothetical protein [Chloroflexota bacterium]